MMGKVDQFSNIVQVNKIGPTLNATLSMLYCYSRQFSTAGFFISIKTDYDRDHDLTRDSQKSIDDVKQLIKTSKKTAIGLAD